MEIVILIAVYLWFVRAARTAARRTPYLWGIAGGITYLAVLILAKAVLYSAIEPPTEHLLAFGIVDIVLTNAAALGGVTACGELLAENLVTLKRVVHVANIGWLIIAVLLLPMSLGGLISGEAVLPALGLVALVVVPLGTRYVHRAESKNLVGPPWHLHIALWTNLLVGVALIWYVTTLRLSQPVAFSISEGYYMSWFALSAWLNALSAGLTLNTRRSAKAR